MSWLVGVENAKAALRGASLIEGKDIDMRPEKVHCGIIDVVDLNLVRKFLTDAAWEKVPSLCHLKVGCL